MALNDQVYPFATQDGKPIPLDIVKPYGLMTKTFTAGIGSSIAIPANTGVCVLYATEDSVISFEDDLPADLVDVTLYAGAMLLPAKTLVTLALDEEASTANVKGIVSSGVLYIQFLQKWAGLSLTIQAQRK